MTPHAPAHTRAFAVASLGIALYSVMDALMKGLSIAIGAYNASLWRALAGMVITGLILVLRKPRWPPLAVLRLHGLRGLLGTLLVFLFFWGVARVPLAEGIALSFIAPLITLYLAAVLLGEKVTRWAVISSLCGLAGVLVIMAARLGGPRSPQAMLGAVAILVSAVVYSFNLILQRRQAMVAAPEESAFFGTAVMAAILLGFAPFAAKPPPMAQVPAILASAMFASAAFITLSWAYARAEARVLVVLEYTAFLWAALLGYVMFKEPVSVRSLMGTGLIVLGWLFSAWHERGHQPSAEVGI